SLRPATPTKFTRSPYRATMSLTSGASARRTVHQGAQNQTTLSAPASVAPSNGASSGVAEANAVEKYSPLCNSAVAYDRRVGDPVMEFGNSGSLWNSALVMYDRQTESLWSHFIGQAIVGELTGTELTTFPVATV